MVNLFPNPWVMSLYPLIHTSSPQSTQVRLAMLYALRFEGDALRLQQITDYLATAGIKDK